MLDKPQMGSLSHIKGNALDEGIKEGHIAMHVCNDKGVMGAGIAAQVAQRFPKAYEAYRSNFSLGSVTTDGSNVINLTCQSNFGKAGSGKYFQESAFIDCLMKVYNDPVFSQFHTIVVPENMGAFRAGGDWDWIISTLYKVLSPKFNILVVAFDTPEVLPK